MLVVHVETKSILHWNVLYFGHSVQILVNFGQLFNIFDFPLFDLLRNFGLEWQREDFNSWSETFNKLQQFNAASQLACVQTSPIPCVWSKKIGDVCTQATSQCKALFLTEIINKIIIDQSFTLNCFVNSNVFVTRVYFSFDVSRWVWNPRH